MKKKWIEVLLQMIEDMLPEETVKVSISEQEDGSRLIRFI